MLTHPTLDQLKALNLDGMANAFVELQNQAQAAELSHAEWLCGTPKSEATSGIAAIRAYPALRKELRIFPLKWPSSIANMLGTFSMMNSDGCSMRTTRTNSL
jgi:hypothetical protein